MRDLLITRLRRWHRYRQRLSTYLRAAAPFVAGMGTALTALLLYNLLFPPTPPLTLGEVNDSIAQAMTLATPPRRLLVSGLSGHSTLAGVHPDRNSA